MQTSIQKMIVVRLFLTDDVVKKKVVKILSEYNLEIVDFSLGNVVVGSENCVNIIESVEFESQKKYPTLIKNNIESSNTILITKKESKSNKYFSSVCESELDLNLEKIVCKLFLEIISVKLSPIAHVQSEIVEKNDQSFLEFDVFKQICDNSIDAVWLYNPDVRRVIYVSPSIKKVCGLEVDDIVGFDIEDVNFVDPAKSMILEELKKFDDKRRRKKNGDVTFCVDFLNEKNQRIYIEISLTQIVFSDSKTFYVQGVSRDVTASKKNEASVVSSISLLDNIIENTHNGVIVIDEHFVVKRINATASEICNKPKDDIVDIYLCQAIECNAFVDNGEEVCSNCHFHRDIEEAFTFSQDHRRQEYQFERTENGRNITRIFMASISIIWQNDEKLAVLYLLDLTNEKAASKEVLKNFSCLTTFLNSSNRITYIKDADNNYIFANTLFVQFVGCNIDTIVGNSPNNILPRNILPIFENNDYAAIASNRLVTNQEKIGDKYYRTRNFPILMEDGSRGVAGIVEDVTEYMKTLDNLTISQRRYSTLLANIPGTAYRAVCTIGEDKKNKWVLTYVSQGCEDLLGFTVNELLYQDPLSVGNIICEEYYDKLVSAWFDAINNNTSFTVELEFNKKNGERIWVLGKGFVKKTNDNHVEYVEGFLSDITFVKNAYKEIAENEAKFRAVTETMKDVIWIADAETLDLSYCSPSAVRLFDISDDDFNDLEKTKAIISSKVSSFLFQLRKDLQKLSDDFNKGLIAENDYFTYETNFDGADGEKVYCEVNIHLVRNVFNGKLEVFGLTRDISPRMKVLHLVKNSEQQYQSLVNTLHGIVYRCKFEEKYSMLFLNDEFEQLTGYAKEDFINNKKYAFSEIIHSADRERLWNNFLAWKNCDGFFEDEYRIIAKSGKVLWVSEKANKMYDENGELCLAGIITDITEKKETSRKIIESENRFKLLANNSIDVIFTTNYRYVITYVSPAVKTVLGFDESEVLGKTLMDFIPKEDLVSVSEKINVLLLQKNFDSVTVNTRLKGKYQNLFAEICVTSLKKGKRIGIQGSIRDVSERVEQQKSIMRAAVRSERLVENSVSAVVIVNKNQEIIFSNSKIKRMFAYDSGKSAKGLFVNDVFPLNRDYNMYKLIQNRLDSGNPVSVKQFEIVTPIGKTFFVKIFASILVNTDDNYEMSILLEDITEKVVREESNYHVQSSEKLVSELSNLLLKDENPIKLFDEALVKIHANFKDQRSYIFIKDEFIGSMTSISVGSCYCASNINNSAALNERAKKLRSVIISIYNDTDKYILCQNADKVTHFSDLDERAFTIKNILIYPLKTLQGEILGFLVSENKNESFSQFDLGNFEKITHLLTSFLVRTRFVNQLESSNRKLDILMNNIATSLFVVDVKKKSFMYTSPSLEKMFGIDGEVIAYKYVFWENFVEPEVLDRYKDLYEKVVNCESDDFSTMEFEASLSKSKKIFSMDLYPVRNKENAVYAVAGVLTDVTEKKVLERNEVNALISGEESERKRLSIELNDGLGPQMTMLRLYMQMMSRMDSPEKILELAKKAEGLFYESVRTLTEISNNLSPHVLYNFGTYEAVKHYVDEVRSNTDVDIRLSCLCNERSESINEISIYRCVRELINNSVKHSKCKHIDIKMDLKKTGCSVKYSDDGVGFNIESVLKSEQGRGLASMRKRIDVLNGKFVMFSNPVKGFSAEIIINNRILN